MGEALPNGYTHELLEGEEHESLKKYDYLSDGAVRVTPGNFLMPKRYLKFAKDYYDFEIRSTDIFVNTYPKSGTHWIQEIVWNLVNNPNLDNPNADTAIDTRCPFLELDQYFNESSLSAMNPEGNIMKKYKEICPNRDFREGIFIFISKFLPDPRLIKCHLPYTLLAKDLLEKAKFVYLARDPRDILVSNYYYFKNHSMVNFIGSIEDMTEDFIKGNIHGSYWDHVKLAWEKRNHPNFLFLFYEDLKQNPKAEISKIDKFIGTHRDENQIDNIIHTTSFSVLKERSKKNPPTSFDNIFLKKDEGEDSTAGSFFRKGQAGSWREDLPPHLQEKLNDWMKENLKQFGNDFKYKAEFQD